jgi:tetratricopeptide (TPR) repeat protein
MNARLFHLPFFSARTTSVDSAAAIALADAATLSLHGGDGQARTLADAALRRDARCVRAHAVRVAVLLLASDQVRDRRVRRPLFHFGALAQVANDRESLHLDAARAWYAGDFPAALNVYDRLLARYPSDSLALQLAHALDFRLGRRESLRDRVANVIPHWNRDMLAYGHVLAMYAFGLEENGDYDHAYEVAQRSLEAAPGNASAIHAIAHVYEMQGRSDEGMSWLTRTERHWRFNRAFGVHLAWHQALFHLDHDDPHAALAVYDERLAPTFDSGTPALVDASALLWRLDLRGIDVQRRWRRVARCWRRKSLADARAFNVVHAVAAFAGAKRHRLVAALIEQLREQARQAHGDDPTTLALAIAVSEAMQAFAQRAYGAAVEKISVVRSLASRCGGSVAQCDLIHLTLIEAALRARATRLARALAEERATQKPRSLLNRWLFARAAATT